MPDIEDEWWQTTQEKLQPLLPDGPQLTEKHLKKPPFRFVHDIFTGLTKAHGLGDGLLDQDEIDPKAITEKSAKIAVLTKIIDYAGAVHRERLQVDPKAIVSGKHPERTNELLRTLARAVKVDRENWEHALKACGQNPEERAAREEDQLQARQKKEKAKAKLQINTGQVVEEAEQDKKVETGQGGEWGEVLEQISAFRKKAQGVGVDVAACKDKAACKGPMGAEIRAVQEEIQASVKAAAAPPPEPKSEAEDLLLMDDEEELVKQISSMLESVRETTHLTMENEQVIERIMHTTGLA